MTTTADDASRQALQQAYATRRAEAVAELETAKASAYAASMSGDVAAADAAHDQISAASARLSALDGALELAERAQRDASAERHRQEQERRRDELADVIEAQITQVGAKVAAARDAVRTAVRLLSEAAGLELACENLQREHTTLRQALGDDPHLRVMTRRPLRQFLDEKPFYATLDVKDTEL